MSTKYCHKCSKLKSIDDFSLCASKRDGRQSSCKECRRKIPQNTERKNAWYRENSQHVKDRVKNNRLSQIDVAREKRRQHYKENTLEYKEREKRRRVRLKSDLVWLEKQEKLKNDPVWRARRAAWKRAYRRLTPHIHAWRSQLRRVLRQMGKKKNASTLEMLGYTANDLKQHIESLWTPGMDWGNYGEWHIDHIKEVATFHPDTPASVVNTLSNLRPLWATTRIVDGVTYIGNQNRDKPKRYYEPTEKSVRVDSRTNPNEET